MLLDRFPQKNKIFHSLFSKTHSTDAHWEKDKLSNVANIDWMKNIFWGLEYFYFPSSKNIPNIDYIYLSCLYPTWNMLGPDRVEVSKDHMGSKDSMAYSEHLQKTLYIFSNL